VTKISQKIDRDDRLEVPLGSHPHRFRHMSSHSKRTRIRLEHIIRGASEDAHMGSQVLNHR
jgi:hypothetical protein